MKTKNFAVCVAGLTLLSQATFAAGQWPTGKDDTITTNVDQGLFIPVLNNDAGSNLTLVEVNDWTTKGGRASLSTDRRMVYFTPKAGFTGDDVFWYSFQDDQGRSNYAKVSVNVQSGSSNTGGSSSGNNSTFTGWPVAIEDNASTTRDTSATISVLGNDLGQSLWLTEVNDWTGRGGRAWISGSDISYQPPVGMVGQDTFWYVLTDSQGRTNSAKVTVAISDSGSGGNTGGPAIGGPQAFDLVKMQNNLLLDTSFQYYNGAPEAGGLSNFNVAYASAGSTQLNLLSGIPQSSLIPNQLITYRASNGNYYTNTISQIQGNSITLKNPLKKSISSGWNLSNFYNDGSHPNSTGFKAIADYAVDSINDSSLNGGKHLMLGDSWFSSGAIAARLEERLPNAWIVNKGIGGSTAADVLARFDRDVAGQNPDVVWLIAGTNDYYQSVSKSAYVNNMKSIIDKIKALGARPIVLDSSVAPLMWGSNSVQNLSKSYATGLAEISANQ